MEASGAEGGKRGGVSRGVRSVLVASGVAFVIHLVPLLLPRNTPEQQLAIARVMTGAVERVRVLRPLKEHPKATAAELREAAELLWEAPGDARELAKEAERREPGAVENPLLVARLCHRERMERCTQEALARAEALAPGDARPDLLRADMRESEGDLAGALEAVERAYEKTRGEEQTGLRYVRLLGKAQRLADAERVLEELEEKLGLARMELERGRLWEGAGKLNEARARYEAAVEESPRLVEGHFRLGWVAYRQGDLERAEEALREADRLNMRDMKPLTTLCAMELESGQQETARILRMDLERRFPEQAEALRKACPVDGR